MPDKVELFSGGLHMDKRGKLSYVNDFTFQGIQRFYQITHSDPTVVRAWQGHRLEHKYFYVSSGSFLVAWVEIDNWDTPSSDLKAEFQILSAEKPQVLHIPPGYANGIKALKAEATLLIFSDFNVQQSELDRWSFDQDLWFDWTKY